MRTALAAAIALALGSMATADPAHASIRKQTNIAPQSLGPALKEFAATRELQLLYVTDTVRNLRTSGAVGEITIDEALTKLLSGTGLTYRYLDDKTITILPVPATIEPVSSRADESEASIWRRFRMAQADEGVVAPAVQPVASEEKSTLEEIVVSAQKRSERLQDVPVPVSALSATGLVENNQSRLQDYFSSVPGLNLALDNRGAPAVSIRGLTSTIYGNPTVATVIDDVPYAGSTYASFGWAATEFDPSELAQVEVLRGPQGVLYGASSLGGLIKFVTVKPSTQGFSARLQMSGNTVRNGDDMGYSASGAVNVPVSETFAVRASGFGRHDAGYIDNVLTGQKGINATDVRGARVSTLWKPSSAFSLQLSALYQRSETDGSSNIETSDVAQGLALGDLQQSYIRDSGTYDRRLKAFTATVEATLGEVALTSVTGYTSGRKIGSFDVSAAAFLRNSSLAQFGVSGDAWVEDNTIDKFSQELRFSGALGSHVDWMAGAYFTDEDADLSGGHRPFDPLTGRQAGVWYLQTGPVTYRESAAFANLTWKLNDRADIQFGGRYGKNHQTFDKTLAGIWAPIVLGQASPIVAPQIRSEDDSFTYLVTPRFKVTPDVMVYGRLASGYRPGGVNTEASPNTGVPLSCGPDTTRNYELGLKGNFLNDVLTVDTSVYYIQWKDMQIGIVDIANGFQEYTINLGRSRTRGLELSLEARPVTGMTISAWSTWSDAELTAPFPPISLAVANAGDPLPYSTKYSGSLSLQQEFALASGVMGYAGASVTYVGTRYGEFGAGFGAGRQEYPSYTKTDLRAGARFGSWTANVFANNIADRRGVIAGGAGTFNPFAFTYIQPRTVGLSLTKTFEP